MNCCQQVIELTDKGKQLKTTLQILCAIEGFTSFLILYELIYSFATVGKIIQVYFAVGALPVKPFIFIVEVLYFAFSIVLLICVFLAYREFKAIALATGAQPQFMSGGMGANRAANVYRSGDYENQQSSNNNNTQSKGGYKAFSGKGTVVGGN